MRRGRPPHDDILTPREWQVLGLLREGLTNEQIAARMGISHNGAKYHVSQIISKLEVSTREEAVEVLRDRRAAVLSGFAFLPALLFDTRRARLGAVAVVGALLFVLGGVWLLRDTGGSEPAQGLLPSEEELQGALLDFAGEPGEKTADTFTDPFEYCRAVETIDEPDYRYTGEMNTPEMVIAFARAFNAPPASPMWQGALSPALYWRCMDGALYACTIGANLPCMGKVDFNTEPTERLIEACKNPPPHTPDPSRFFLAAVTTGRVTAYRWECIDGVPTPGGPPAEADAQGFFVRYWYRLSPS